MVLYDFDFVDMGDEATQYRYTTQSEGQCPLIGPLDIGCVSDFAISGAITAQQ